MTPAEPMTAATDVVLAAIAAWAAVRVARANRSTPAVSRRWWAVAFTATAVAALGGAVWHGVRAALPPDLAAGIWKATLIASGWTSASLLVATAFAHCTRAFRTVALVLTGLGAVVYLVRIFASDDFLTVILASGLALLTTGVAHAARWRTPGSPAIVLGVGIALLGGAVQASGWSILPGVFDHNDLYHVIVCVALIVLQSGATRVIDRDRATEP